MNSVVELLEYATRPSGGGWFGFIVFCATIMMIMTLLGYCAWQAKFYPLEEAKDLTSGPVCSNTETMLTGLFVFIFCSMGVFTAFWMVWNFIAFSNTPSWGQ